MRRVLVAALLVGACRDPAPRAEPAEAAAPIDSEEPRHAEAKPEAGALVDERCEGVKLSLFEPACEITDTSFVETAVPAHGELVQEAHRDADGMVTFAVANKSAKAVWLPIRFDDRDLGKGFSVAAEAIPGPGVYALATPRVRFEGGDAGAAHLHSTRIRISPGGRATAKLDVVWDVVQRLDRRDAGASQVEGKLAVHIGLLVSHVDMGDPAKIVLSKSINAARTAKDAAAN